VTERYHLTLTALSNWPTRHEAIPPDTRLRAALKALLRRHGLRCDDARAEVVAGPTATEIVLAPIGGNGTR
jgi:hypothetical protein